MNHKQNSQAIHDQITALTKANHNLAEMLRGEMKRSIKADRRVGRLEKELTEARARRDHWFKEREKELDNIEVLQNQLRRLEKDTEQLRAQLDAGPNGGNDDSYKVYELDLPGYDENAGEGKDGVLWLVLSPAQAHEVGIYAERLGETRFCVVDGQADEFDGAIDYDCRENARMDALVKRLDNEINAKRYPIGTRLISLTAQLDDDEEGNERITPAGSEWIVCGLEESSGTQARHLECKASGAWIIPFLADIDRTFKVKAV